MPPSRADRGKDVAESSRPRQRARRIPNAHNIIFEELAHQERYDVHVKRKLTPTRCMCDKTLSDLGLQDEIDRMFHSLGMLEFMHLEAPTYERITLEFLSTVEFKLEKRWTGSSREYYGNLKFRMYNNDHVMSVEDLAQILYLPRVGPGSVPDDFAAGDFWSAITGLPVYVPKSAKASWIQNPCFRYAQKGLAYTLFGRGDGTGVAAKRELFFLFSMVHDLPVNAAAFAADHLGKVGRATSGDISVGGMITQIAEHYGYRAVLDGENAVAALSKIDLSALIRQGMIEVRRDCYALISRKRCILKLPNSDKVSISDYDNWLYTVAVSEVGDGNNADDFVAGDDMEEGDFVAQEQFVPPPHDTTHQASGSYSMNQDQWEWMQNEIGHLRTEQSRQGEELSRQGIEQARQGTVLDEMNVMMQRMMLHRPHPPPPPQ